jgi:hypothetical protein
MTFITCPDCTALAGSPAAPSVYPANVRAKGELGVGENDPRDQITVSYEQITSFSIRFGKTNPALSNYYGTQELVLHACVLAACWQRGLLACLVVARRSGHAAGLFELQLHPGPAHPVVFKHTGIAFKELPWGDNYTAVAVAPVSYTISYDPNGATSGSVPANHTDVFGSSYTVVGNTGSLVRTGVFVYKLAASPFGLFICKCASVWVAHAHQQQSPIQTTCPPILLLSRLHLCGLVICGRRFNRPAAGQQRNLCYDRRPGAVGAVDPRRANSDRRRLQLHLQPAVHAARRRHIHKRRERLPQLHHGRVERQPLHCWSLATGGRQQRLVHLPATAVSDTRLKITFFLCIAPAQTDADGSVGRRARERAILKLQTHTIISGALLALSPSPTQ